MLMRKGKEKREEEAASAEVFNAAQSEWATPVGVT